MSQNIRKSSGSSSSSESELSDGWNVIDNIEENNLESITDIQDDITSENHSGNEEVSSIITDNQVDLASENHSGDEEVSLINHSRDQTEVGLATHESSSDGESVEVIDHEDLVYSDESSFITNLHIKTYYLEEDGLADGDIITEEDTVQLENSVNPDIVELRKPFIEKFEEIMSSPWCWYIMVILCVLVTLNMCTWLTSVMLNCNMDSMEVQKRVEEIDDLPKLLNNDKYLALDDIEEINTCDYVARDGSNNNNIDVHKSSSKEYEDDVGIYSYRQMDGVIDQDVDIKKDFDQERNVDTLLKSERQLVNRDLNMKQTLVNDALSLDSLNTFEKNGPINELNIQDEEFIDIKEIDKDKSKRMHTNDLKFDTSNLGKTFKLLSDLTSSQDSKYKFGHSLMIMDSVYVGLSDLELYISENSPLHFKLKKQKFKVSHSIAEEIKNAITISVDKLANNIFNKVQKLEKNIQTHWCRLQNDLDQIKSVQNHLFYDCDDKKDKRKNVERKLTKNQNKYELDKDSVGKDNSNQIKSGKNNDYVDNLQSRDDKKQFKDLKKKQDKDYLIINKGKNYENNPKNRQKTKFNNEQTKFQKQTKNKKHILKNKSEKMDENVNKENITQKWGNKQNNNTPLRHKYREQKKVIDIELNSVDKNYGKKLDPNVIENENNDNQWNIFIKEKKMDNKTILSGEWFLNSGDARSEVRWNHHRSDWVFDRAYARRNKKYTSQWFFQRAWARQQCRLYPSLNWCKKTIMTLHTNSKFR